MVFDDDEGVADAMRRDAEMDIDPAQGMTLRELDSHDSFAGLMAKRKQASRTPNASRIMTSRSMSEPQCLKEQPNLAAAFGVREACFRFGVSAASVAL